MDVNRKRLQVPQIVRDTVGKYVLGLTVQPAGIGELGFIPLRDRLRSEDGLGHQYLHEK
jgi:hypothetical protein